MASCLFSGVSRRYAFFMLLNLLCFSSVISAQTTGGSSESLRVSDGVFRHLDLGVSVGTTGLGIDVASDINEIIRVRAGFDFVPRFTVPMAFSLQSYTDGGVNSGNFATMQKYMEGLTGFEVDDRVEMDGKPMMYNFKLIFDVYPWRDKGWRFSAGCFFGSRKVAKAINTMGEMPSLLAVNIYNHFYDYFMTTDFFETPIYGDYYLDPFLVDDVRADLEKNGLMGIHIGDFKDGSPYMMQPDSEGMVKASAYVNAVRPYVGLGYTGPLSKNKRLNLDIDLGMMMWGGSPTIVTHDGVDLTTEVVNIKGKPGDYVDFFKGIKVYPVLNFRISYRLF
ncbi:MAG: hypothetical protein NC212_02260 [Staphylococcus sp.]|nr:hypothetical protein [Staphylococcus sp.]